MKFVKNKKSKIAIIGNMNNSGFNLMRYFRDLGLDAHLFLYSNDGKGENSHFIPQNDTINYQKWLPYIHKTKISNHLISGTDILSSILVFIWSFIFSKNKCNLPPSKKYFIKLFNNYDYFIGNGIAPALFYRMKKKLNIFYPYAIGIEFFNQPEISSIIKNNNFLKNYFYKQMIRNQKKGIEHTENIFDIGVIDNLTKKMIRKKVVNKLYPSVYNREKIKKKNIPSFIKNLLKKIKNNDINFFGHSRQLWIKPKNLTKEEWVKENKNSNWIIESFSKIVKAYKNKKLFLILIEYGENVQQSKNLCMKLGIEKNVIWIPKMKMKEIKLILEKIHIVFGEFYSIKNINLGSTGYESLSLGKPLINSFRFNKSYYKNTFGHEVPPILIANSKKSIYLILLKIINNQIKLSIISNKSHRWFIDNCGIKLASQWNKSINENLKRN